MDTDVVIVGFGPTGAALAGMLAQRGVRVTILEKSPEVFSQPRAAHIDHTGLRTLQELGCLQAVLPPMIRNQSLDLVNHDHELLLRLPAGQESVSGLPTSVYFYQPELDRTLRDAVSAMPLVDVQLGHEMTAFDSTEGGVVVDYATLDGHKGSVSGRWLVGCDGSWSPVREAMGSKLASLNFDERWLVLDLKLSQVPPGLPTDRVVQVCDPDRPHLTTPISANRQRFEFMLMPGDSPVSIVQPESVAALLASWLPNDSYVIERSAIYTFHGLIAERWRNGRVLIAGDAAHQMPPFLGQGMCSGLRDATNLAWKLASIVTDGANEAILDTYEAERSPHVRRIIEAAIGFGELVCITDHAEAAARDRRLLVDKQTPDILAKFALPKLTPGPLVRHGGGALFVQPDIEGVRLDDLVGARFLVVSRTAADLGQKAKWWSDEIGAHLITLDETPNEALMRWMKRFGANVVVVRPDRYVMATGTSLDSITEDVEMVLRGPSARSHKSKNTASVN
jgi:3-(3-hydroxy-phenyl)propionate hydroxylase